MGMSSKVGVMTKEGRSVVLSLSYQILSQYDLI